MSTLLIACQLLPLLGWLLIFVAPQNEHLITQISFWLSRAMGLNILLLLAYWTYNGFPDFTYQWFMLYQEEGYSFPILLYFDRVSAAYLFCVWSIFAIIVKYCRVYLHRETGYKRFFQTIFGFVFGLNLIVLSGSIDMLFAGWEIVGISSFLLIAFYRHRAQPVRNALRAYTIYRFCDVGLLLGAWMSHLLFHESQHFNQLLNLFSNPDFHPESPTALWLLALLVILAASGKSAQFPFCFWLPRAMEGPTPSSAIFYGALSIHLGVFLLLRTLPIWSFHWLPRLMVFSIGFLTVMIARLSENTQSNIKGQIAYASITQVGLMFIELSLGLDTWVLVHFMSNAFLRCYQLLVSPSIVAHLLRVEGSVTSDSYIKTSHLEFLPISIRHSLPEVLQNTLYVFALQEAHLEYWVKSILWDPLKRIGHILNRQAIWQRVLILTSLLGLAFILREDDGNALASIPISAGMVLMSLAAFSQKYSPFRVWNNVALSSALAGFAVWLMNPQALDDVVMFMSGIIPAWLMGLWSLKTLLAHERFADSPFIYRAMAETHPRLSLLLFISFLGLVGFPITPAFLGEDLLLSHASHQHPWFAAPITIAFVVNGIAVARIFMRLCMGRPSELAH